MVLIPWTFKKSPRFLCIDADEHDCRPADEKKRKSQDPSPQMTRMPNTQSRVPLMRLSDQPAPQVRLAASSKRDGNEWAWVVNAAPTAAAVWAERKCEVAGNAAKNARAVFRVRFCCWNAKSAPPLLRSIPWAEKNAQSQQVPH